MAITLPFPRIAPAPAPAPIPTPLPRPAPIPARTRERTHVSPSRDALVQHGTRLGVIVACACVAIFLDASTSYESATALPYIEGALGATPDQGSWIVTLFNAAYATSILMSPWFLTRFGRRAYFSASLAAFAACSIACALATSYDVFLVMRLLQGFALGAFFACGVLSLFMSIPAPLQLIGVMLFSLASQMGGAVGPAIAGYLVYNDAWQWVFVLGALPAAALAVAIWYVLDDPEEPRRVPFDAIGAALIAATFLALQYVANEGERRDWFDDPWITIALVATPVCGAAMLLWKLRYSPHPFLDFRVLRHRNLVVGAVFGFGFGLVLQAATQIGGFVEQTLDFTPTLGGGLDALRAVAIVIFVPIATVAMAKQWLGTRTALLLGLAVTFVGFRLEVVATTSQADFTSFILPFAGIGIGIAILYRALATVIFGSLPREELIMGLLIYKMSGVLGGAIATPVLATLLDHLTDGHRSDLAAGVTLTSPTVRAFIDHAGGTVSALAHEVGAEATTLAYSDLWSFASIIVVALVPAIALLQRKPQVR
jgi:DHA2 family multidrug resistance protein